MNFGWHRSGQEPRTVCLDWRWVAAWTAEWMDGHLKGRKLIGRIWQIHLKINGIRRSLIPHRLHCERVSTEG